MALELSDTCLLYLKEHTNSHYDAKIPTTCCFGDASKIILVKELCLNGNLVVRLIENHSYI